MNLPPAIPSLPSGESMPDMDEAYTQRKQRAARAKWERAERAEGYTEDEIRRGRSSFGAEAAKYGFAGKPPPGRDAWEAQERAQGYTEEEIARGREGFGAEAAKYGFAGVTEGDVQLAKAYKVIDAGYDWRAATAARIERRMAELARLRDEFISDY